MKQIMTLIVSLVTMMVTAQQVSYAPSGLIASTGVLLIAESDTVGNFYVCTAQPNFNTLVVLERADQTRDTVGVVPFVVNTGTIAPSLVGDVLWLAGENIAGSSDTNCVGIKLDLGSFIWPASFPQGVITSCVVVPNGALFGGSFTAVNTQTANTYTNLVKVIFSSGVFNWGAPSSACVSGLNQGVTALKKMQNGTIVVASIPSSADTLLQYCTLSASQILDTITTHFVPSTFPDAWQIVSMAEDVQSGMSFLAVTVSDTSTRTYILPTVIGDTAVFVPTVITGTAKQVEYTERKLWIALWQSNPDYYLASTWDGSPGITPRFTHRVGSSTVNGMVSTSSGLIVYGSFQYKVTAGDTVKNSFVVTVADTTPPTLVLTSGTDSVYYPLGTPYSFLEVWFTNGYAASDNFDGDITAQVVHTGTIDSAHVGCSLITYTVTDQAGYSDTAYRWVCITDTATMVSEIPLEVLGLYPNPANTGVFLQVIEPVVTQILSLEGQLVYEQRCSLGTNQIGLSEIPSGMYLMKIGSQDGTRSTTKKLMILH